MTAFDEITSELKRPNIERLNSPIGVAHRDETTVLGTGTGRRLFERSQLHRCREGVWQCVLAILMLAKGGTIIADDARKVRFHLEDEHMDPTSGKPVASVVVYEFEDGPERYRVSYRHSETIVDDKLIERLSGFKHLLAKRARFDGAYLRFTGNVQLERFVHGELEEDVSDPAICEKMYVGHVYR